MRLAFGLIGPLFCSAALAFGCGETASDGDQAAGAAGQSMTAGAAGSSSSAGTSSSGGAGVAGTTSNGGSSAGTSAAGTSSSGGSGGGGANGGSSAGGNNEGGSSVGGSGLVDCDTRKVLCRIVTPDCPAGEVPSVKGTCYGECVKIDRCSCASADQCPEPEQYTCLKGPMHCSYYLK